MTWDWFTAGVKNTNGANMTIRDANGAPIYDTQKGTFTWAKNVRPDYVWFNGTVDYTLVDDVIDPSKRVSMNRLHEDINDPRARILPVKRFTGRQPYDPVRNVVVVPTLFANDAADANAYWKLFNWTNALASGMAYVERPYSGEVGFIDTEWFWIENHMVAPKEKALSCAQCHTETGGRLEFAALGYSSNQLAFSVTAGAAGWLLRPPVLTAAPVDLPEMVVCRTPTFTAVCCTGAGAAAGGFVGGAAGWGDPPWERSGAERVISREPQPGHVTMASGLASAPIGDLQRGHFMRWSGPGAWWAGAKREYNVGLRMLMDRPRDPDLAARLFGTKPEHTLALLQAAWPGAVGEETARSPEVVAFDHGVLRIKVPDLRWQRTLVRMRGDILGRLRRVAGQASPRGLSSVPR